MKNILLFGCGANGKKLVDEYIKYSGCHKIIGIVDNNTSLASYRGIQIVHPKDIRKFDYDEIWVCTIYFLEVKKQLVDKYSVEEKKILYVEPVVPILEERIRKKYRQELYQNKRIESDLREVLEYIKDHPVHMYCYPFYDEYVHHNTPIYFDEEKQLYYAYYHSNKIYFSKKMDTEQKARSYYNSVLMEQDVRSPHCYHNGRCMENVSGVCVDIGAAEGIFALDVIDKVDHIYIIEVDAEWIEALRYTFEPFMEKVTIVQKFVSNIDNDLCTRLDTLFQKINIDYIKMDIEGGELEALQGSESLLKKNNINLAVCVYHHSNDNCEIGEWLQKRGYKTENSHGYILCQGDWELESDETDFRKGLIFAQK